MVVFVGMDVTVGRLELLAPLVMLLAELETWDLPICELEDPVP
jgi:hypothetical protein